MSTCPSCGWPCTEVLFTLCACPNAQCRNYDEGQRYRVEINPNTFPLLLRHVYDEHQGGES